MNDEAQPVEAAAASVLQLAPQIDLPTKLEEVDLLAYVNLQLQGQLIAEQRKSLDLRALLIQEQNKSLDARTGEKYQLGPNDQIDFKSGGVIVRKAATE